MHRKGIRFLSAGLVLLAAGGRQPALAGDLSGQQARSLAATCANCHGTNGQAVAGSGMSSLAGGDADRMMQVLREFRSGTRPATIMHQIARGYREEQLQAIANYFAAQRREP